MIDLNNKKNWDNSYAILIRLRKDVIYFKEVLELKGDHVKNEASEHSITLGPQFSLLVISDVLPL